MSAMSRRKGAAAENEVVKHLRSHGFPWAERRLTGSDDPYGDITGIPGVVLEVKNQAASALGEWVNQLADELHHSGADTGAVIHKRKGKTNVGDWYATMPVDQLLRLLRAAGYGTPLDSATADYQAKVRDLKAQRAELMGGDAA